MTAYPAAVLWDMDGTAVDSEPYWFAAESAMARDRGAHWSPQDAKDVVGRSLLDSARVFKDRTGIELDPREIVDNWLVEVTSRMRAEVPWRPGARELLTELRAAGVPCALVTASWQSFVDAFLAGVPAGSFQAVVTGDRVARGKPDPESYLLAAEELGVAAADCVALEDSIPGVHSATAAGVPTIGIPNVAVLPTDLPGLTIIDTLAGVGAADLSAIARRAVSLR